MILNRLLMALGVVGFFLLAGAILNGVSTQFTRDTPIECGTHGLRC